jgi:hypothetical protein
MAPCTGDLAAGVDATGHRMTGLRRSLLVVLRLQRVQTWRSAVRAERQLNNMLPTLEPTTLEDSRRIESLGS